MNLDKIDKVTKGKTKTAGVSPFSELELSKVYPNPNQPRKSFTGIPELAAQIAQDGLLQPIAVVKREDGYMIVSGERRYQAHVYNDAKTIKAHIITADDAKVQELALIENIQREDLTPFEVAKHITQLWASGNYERKSNLAAALGKPASYISKTFKAVKLSPAITDHLEESKSDIGLEILQELSRIKDEETQIDLYLAGATREQIREAAANQSGKVSPAKKETVNIIWELEEGHNGNRYAIEDILRMAAYLGFSYPKRISDLIAGDHEHYKKARFKIIVEEIIEDATDQ